MWNTFTMRTTCKKLLNSIYFFSVRKFLLKPTVNTKMYWNWLKMMTTNEQIVVNFKRSISFQRKCDLDTSYIGANNLMCITKRKVTKIETIDKLWYLDGTHRVEHFTHNIDKRETLTRYSEKSFFFLQRNKCDNDTLSAD